MVASRTPSRRRAAAADEPATPTATMNKSPAPQRTAAKADSKAKAAPRSSAKTASKAKAAAPASNMKRSNSVSNFNRTFPKRQLERENMPFGQALMYLLMTLLITAAAVWHFLPGHGLTYHNVDGRFGWHFQYLTFNSLLIQSLAMLSTVVNRHSSTGNFLSCLSFGIVNVVFLTYWPITYLSPGGLERNAPVWVHVASHMVNFFAAWYDLFTQPRRFSTSDRNALLAFAAFFVPWLYYCKGVNGTFVYPFLEKLAGPAQHGAFVAGVLALLFFTRSIGSVLSWY